MLLQTANSKIVNNIFFEYYYNTSENIIKIPSPSSSLPSTPLSIQSSKSISTTSSESLNVEQLQQLEHIQLQQMFINAYTNEEYVCLDDIGDDVLKPIHINCSYFNYNPVIDSTLNKRRNSTNLNTTPGLLKISKRQSQVAEPQKRSSSVSTSSPSSCSFSSSNSLSSSSIALLSPQQNKQQQHHNFSVTTPDTSNSSSATMIIRKSPPVTQNTQNIKNNALIGKTNLNYIFSQFDNKISGSASKRSSVPNYENDFISQQQNKRKISSLSPIMTSSRADLNTICCNETPKQPQKQLNFNKCEETATQVKQLKSILLQNSTPVLNHKKFVSFKPHPYQIEFDYEDETDEVDDEDDEIEEDATFINAYSNDTYGLYLSPPVKNTNNDNYKELNKFIEENKQRVERLRVKRLHGNNRNSLSSGFNSNSSPFVCLV